MNINWKNYERIKHLLTKFKNKLDLFQKDEKEDSNLKLQNNKFDFLDIIGHFNIVSKLIDIFLTNWFQNYQIYSYDQLEEKLKKYFQENNDILKYKLIISRVILEILTKIYSLKDDYLKIIEDSLLYFLMFVGRDDKCTSFLIYILKDNAFLLVSLCPLYKDSMRSSVVNIENEENLNDVNNMSLNLTLDNEEIQKRRKKFKKLKYFNIYKCFQRILNDYNNMPSDKLRINFYSLDLFFVFLTTLLIYNNNPFMQFYKDYFSNLGLLKSEEGSVKLIPNYENNHILTYFFLKEDEIYVRSFPFLNNDKKNPEQIWEYKLSDLVDIIGNYNLENEEERNKIFFAKLVNLNIIFYSTLSICDDKFKEYLQEKFKFEILTKNFFTFTYNEIIGQNEINIDIPKKKYESPLLNETKCALMQMLAFLYLKERNPYIAKTHLFKCINGVDNEEITDKKIIELNEVIKFINDIFTEKYNKLELNKIDHLCLIEFIELIKYTLRNLYLLKDNKNQSTRTNIYSLMKYMILLFQKIIGFSIEELEHEKKVREEQERIEKDYEKNDGKKLEKIYVEKNKEKTLEDILNDKLILKDPMLLVSENFEFVYIRIKKKIENLVMKPKEKINEVNYFINILKDICDINNIQKTRYDSDVAKKIKQNKKLLKKFDLTSVLMNISVLSNRNSDFLSYSILHRIEEIIKEFLQYLEHSTIEDLGEKNINKETITRDDYYKGIKEEVSDKISTKYLDEFRQKMYNNSNVISLSFFKFLQIIKNETLRELALDIIFYLNSSKNLFYYNLNNLVIFEDYAQYTKFISIKNIFIKLFEIIKSLNIGNRIDKNALYFIKLLSTNIENLLNILFDDDEWTKQNNALNRDQDFEYQDSLGLPKENEENSFSLSNKVKKIDEEEDDKESEKEVEEDLIPQEKSIEDNSLKDGSGDAFNSIKTIEEKKIETEELPKKDDKKKTDKYFMNEFDKTNLIIFQKTLNNLEFIDFLVQFFEYIDKLTILKDDLEGEFKSLEDSIISIYKILVAFIYKNNNTQSFIKLRLYLFLCPLKFKNISQDLLYSVNYFLFHLVENYKCKLDYAKISNIEDVIDKLYQMHYLDWSKHKRNMPYFFKTLLMFFEYSTPENILPIFILLNDIENYVLNDILSGKDNYNSIGILIKLLEFIEEELYKKCLKEYKNRPLLSMSNIIKAIPKFLDFLLHHSKYDLKNLAYSRVLILIINIILDYHATYYKSDIELNKTEILNSLLNFCEKIVIKNELIYTGKIDSKNKYSKYIKYFNEFMGISLPKFYILLSIFGIPEYTEILDTSNKFYEKIEVLLENDKNEKIFLDESHKDDIFEIFENLRNSSLLFKDILPSLQRIIDKQKIIGENDSSSAEEDNKIIEPQEQILANENKNDEENWGNENSNDFYSDAHKEVEEERRSYIKKLFYFFDLINTNNKKEDNDNKDVKFYSSFCSSFMKMYGEYILKSRIFFLYRTNIIIMNFDQNEKKFSDEKQENPIFNKNFFNDFDFAEKTIENFKKINLNINNYENFIYVQFLNSYLNKLDEENAEKFLLKIIEKQESGKLFHLLHNILDNLIDKINNDINNIVYQKEKYLDICPSSINEEKIDPFLLAITFLKNLSVSNKKIKNKMKEYLILQYNNPKNHNFILIAADILEHFAFENNLSLIPNYFDIIIKIIEFLSTCCSGPFKGSQECIVKDTHVLDFIKLILQKVRYRKKLYDNDGRRIKEESDVINISDGHVVKPYNRRKLSYLKYKLLNLLNSLTIGRKKGDKIFELIHQIIDFDVLTSVLIETHKEIILENHAQNNPEGFIYEENLLFRMTNLDDYLKDSNGINKFIIYENGTFSYILINLYLENLTRPTTTNSYNALVEIKQQLEKDKCNVVTKSHFQSFIKNIKNYYANLKTCFKKILSTVGNCYKDKDSENDFELDSCLKRSFSFYFNNTPHIELSIHGKIQKYYIKLSPICNCLTSEMKEEFHETIDRASAKTKVAGLFNQVEFFRRQLIMNKKILDAFTQAPILNLFFNHYQFYRDVFLIIAVIINLLIFMSFYRVTDDSRTVTSKDYDLEFDYGFLYEKGNIPGTKKAFLVLTVIELILAVLILVNYVIFRVSYLIYKKLDGDEPEEEKEVKKELQKPDKNKEILKFLFERFGNFILNLLQDAKLFYHLFLLIIIILTLSWDKKYKILSVLLLDIIERSSTLICIVKSFWIPKKQIIVTLMLFYLVAYYFIIFVYLFIPSEVPKEDCFKFSDCYFTLCDQAIKNSNGIINYLKEEGLYIYDSLWSNPRFWIDNWFAILDIMLVMQMFCGIIIDTYLSQRERNRDIEKDKNNKCFICGLDKNELNKYYSSEFGFNEHIKLDHYLWNYMFVVFNVTTMMESNMIYLDKIIKKGYETNVYSSWVPYKTCLNQKEKETEKKENEDENKDNNEEKKD